MAASASLPLVRIAEGVYGYHGVHALMTSANQGAICNVGVIVGNEAVAVIDSGGSIRQAKALLAAIADVTDRPVRYLINTHMHPDHVFGNAVFREMGATLVGHRNLPRALAARAEFYLRSFRREMGEPAMQGVEIVAPSLLIDSEHVLDLGSRRLELKAWKPAHTDNDLTVLDARSGILFAGDLVFLEHLPTIDGSLLGWLKQLDDLAAIKAQRVMPGHGPLTADWPGALAAEREYLEALARDLRKAIAEGNPMADAVQIAAASERGKWQLFEEHNQRNAAAAFAELEWE